MVKKYRWLLLLCVLTAVLYGRALRALALLAVHDDPYTHILFVPFVSAYFAFEKRKAILAGAGHSWMAGGALAAAGLLLWTFQWVPSFSFIKEGYAFWMACSMLLFFTGGCISLYGMQLLKTATFPVFFLLLCIPLPALLLNVIVHFFQSGTALVTHGILKLSGATFLRDGLTFYLPSVSINIAAECSGIRSSIVLFITGLVAGHIFLRTWAGKIVVAGLCIPLVLIKNGIRVATLVLLADKVDAGYITHSSLHRNGGFVFFCIALLLLLVVIVVIARVERKKNGGKSASSRSHAGAATGPL